jgi:ATP-binding protein involved in chromosome partitioning
MSVSEAQVLEALRNVQDPDLHRDIVSLGFVKDIKICGGNVAVKVELTTPACPVKEQIKQQCEELVSQIPGVDQVAVEMTAQVRARQTQQEDLIPGVKQCIAIASGKGGVGKSTVAANLAIALAQTGARVGLMDADVYGPTIPLLMGCAEERPFTRKGKILPIERYGIQLMSLGFLLEEGQAVLWRGPMVAGTVRQLLADVEWGELDYLLVDLPPGTGDAPMSLAQLVPLTGAVIVATPHNVAANIAGKATALFRRLKSPILGVIENMAEYVCPCCEHTSRLFSGIIGEELAQKLQAPFLGSIPLDAMISQSSDEGVPSIIAYPERPQAKAFQAIAGKLAAQVSILTVNPELADQEETPEAMKTLL